MKCLLDTHTAFWYFAGSPELSHRAKAMIEDSTNEIIVSTISAWEIAIKRSVDREKTPLCSVDEFFTELSPLARISNVYCHFREGLTTYVAYPCERG